MRVVSPELDNAMTAVSSSTRSRVVVGELQALHRLARHAEHAVSSACRAAIMTASESPQPTSTTRRIPVAEPVGDDVESCGIELQCGPYRGRLAEQFRSGRLDAEAQFRVQWVVARQRQDVGALGVGDPSARRRADGRRAGWYPGREGGSREHSSWMASLSFLSHGERQSQLAWKRTVYRLCFVRMAFRGIPVTGRTARRSGKESRLRSACSGDARGIAQVCGRRHGSSVNQALISFPMVSGWSSGR